MARDIVKFMLADRPDLRKELIRKKWKLAIMAETEVTYDIPEHRKFRPLPLIDDERLTPQQRENYYKPGGVGTMTGEQYWNSRGRGFGGEPNGENTTSCAEKMLARRSDAGVVHERCALEVLVALCLPAPMRRLRSRRHCGGAKGSASGLARTRRHV